LNRDGLCMVTSKVLDQGKIILLGITLPDDYVIHVYGRVAWCKNKQPNVFESGIEFLDIKKEDREILENFVKEKADEQSPPLPPGELSIFPGTKDTNVSPGL
jgi:Tfp pilus assembly protein PilZ